MRRGLPIGRLFGTDIYCDFTFFVLIGFYFLTAEPGLAAIFSAAVILSVLVHEFGHVLAVRRLLKAPSIVVLWMLGGLCIYRGSPRPGHQAAISLMGPAFSFALGALAYGAGALLLPAPLHLPRPPAGTPLGYFLWIMFWINAIWGVANLLPALPLDGGQALRAGLRSGLGRPRADRVMRVVSLAIGLLAVAAALLLGRPFAAFLGALLILENLKRPEVPV
ncbi:MAG TPA: site-2 protease family protein [Planctomycetota bacterium]|nr:site-2 protease family protein [Planctomycetota bacterium]